MARTGYKITVYLDDNPNSSGYMETYEERTYDSGACPISEDDLVLVSNTCEIDLSGYTGYRILIYYNRTTGEYSEVREEDEECIPSSTEEVWVNSGSPYCETNEQGYNTGYMLQLQVQTNPNAPSYGQTRYERYKSPECGDNSCPKWDELQRSCHLSVINCVATFDGTADVVQIDINPMSSTYNQTRTINIEDSACTNCTSTVFSWGTSAETCGDDSIICNNGILVDKDGNTIKNTNKYGIRRKYKSIGGGTPIAMDDYEITLIEENSEDCGYIAPQYRWDVVAGEFLCDYETYTKYEMKMKMVSYDSGLTWSAVVPTETERGDVIAYESYDCGMPMYRWVPTGDFTCVDNEDDWKVKVTYSGGTEYIVPCNESATLVASECSGISSSLRATSVDIGDCVNDVNCTITPITGSPTLHLGEYVEIIGTGNGRLVGTTCLIAEDTFNDNLRIIRNGAFQRTTSFNNELIHLGSKIESLGSYSFKRGYNMSELNLRTVIIDALIPPTVTSDSFTIGGTYGVNAFFVPSGSVDTYRTAWGSSYSNYIFSQAEEDTFFRATYTGNVQGWNFSQEGTNGVLTKEMVHASYKGRTISSMTSAYMSDNITEIGASAFTPYFNTYSSGAAISLTSVSLPKNLVTIGNSAFGGNLADNSVGCSALTSVDTSRCERLATIGDYAFHNCGLLTAMTIPNTVTRIGNYTFWMCSGLTEMELPNSVTNIGEYAFKNCSGLTNVSLPSGLTSISEGTFESCSNLLSVTIPNNVTNIGNYAFARCTKLVSLEIPSGVTNIGHSTFITCDRLTSVTIYATTPPTLTTIGGTSNLFASTCCPVLVPSGSVNAYKTAWSEYKKRIVAIDDYKLLSSYNDETVYAVQYDGGTTLNTGITRAHSTSYQNMTTALIGENVTFIDTNSFYNCSNLHGITCLAQTPPTLGTYVFNNTNNCPIYVPCSSISAYRTAWSNYASRIQGIPPCVGFNKLILSYSNGTSYSAECDASDTITSASTRPSGYEYSSMTSAIIGDCITTIGTSGFSNCSSLTSVTIPDSVTSIGERAFNRCSGLTSVNIPSGVTAINNAAFAWCEALTTVNIPNSVQTMGYSVFSRCSGLTSVTIGTSLTRIGNYEFEYCESLQSITIYATTPPELGTEPFRGTSLAAIFVPSDRVNTYKSASGWSSYASLIQAIPT